MPISKQSFISNLVDNQNYDEFRGYAILVVPVGSIVLLILYALSSFLHSGVINYFVNLTNGLSLLFIVYIALFIILLDIRVEVDESERNSWDNPEKISKPFTYKLTVVWAVVLATFGIFAIYFSEKYRNHYSFECDTFYVDNKEGIYHMDIFVDDCEKAVNAESLEELRGYQIDKTFTLCENCEEILEDYGP